MSLLLRQACQPYIDDMGLFHLYADISNKPYRNLTLYNECGRAVCTISGISFSRQNPGQKELEYATELFNAFLVKHGALFVKYKQNLQAYKNIPIPLIDPKYGAYFTGRNLIYKDNYLKVTLEKDLTISELSCIPKKTLSFDDVKLDKVLYATMCKVLDEYLKRKNIKDSIEEILSEISSCNI